jgi:hypothetical protein
LGSTEKLTSDIVYLPVQYIEPHSEKLSVLYSINLKQYAISNDNYLFLQKMKKNTEQLGTIFDPQPSEISGNIHCLTDPNELVIGLLKLPRSKLKECSFLTPGARLGLLFGCVQEIIDNNLDSIRKHGSDLYPTTPQSLDGFGAILKFLCDTDKKLYELHFSRSKSKTCILAMKMILKKRYFKVFMTCMIAMMSFAQCKQEYDPHIEAKTTDCW